MYIEDYEKYLTNEKKTSANTLQAYSGDVREFAAFLRERKNADDDALLSGAVDTDVISYLLGLREAGKSSSTINRKVASLRNFYRFLITRGIVNDNPVVRVKTQKVEAREIEYLTIDEVDRLLSLPDDTVKGKRDKAILETLYATGIKVSEAVDILVDDVNLRMGFITCRGVRGKARIIPLGRPARAALEDYVYDVRKEFVRGAKAGTEKHLFVNFRGEQLTRQGLWKIIKEYAKQAGVEQNITPQTLRNSFAAHMVQNGADLKTLQDLLGHEDITTTQIYLSVTKNRIKDVYDRTHPRA